MSNTCVATRPSALDDMPWVEIDGDLEDAFEEFAAVADRRIDERNAPTSNTDIVVEPAADEVGLEAADHLRALDRAAYEDLLHVQELPLIDDETDAVAYEEATSGYAPSLADPLPHK
jgi:hypothetical protein